MRKHVDVQDELRFAACELRFRDADFWELRRAAEHETWDAAVEAERWRVQNRGKPVPRRATPQPARLALQEALWYQQERAKRARRKTGRPNTTIRDLKIALAYWLVRIAQPLGTRPRAIEAARRVIGAPTLASGTIINIAERYRDFLLSSLEEWFMAGGKPFSNAGQVLRYDDIPRVLNPTARKIGRLREYLRGVSEQGVARTSELLQSRRSDVVPAALPANPGWSESSAGRPPRSVSPRKIGSL